LARFLVGMEQIAVDAVGDDAVAGAPHERGFGKAALRQLLRQKDGERHATEREARQQVPRRAGRAGAVHDHHGPVERSERSEPDVARPVDEHDVCRQVAKAPPQRARAP
jgi:hypothetical protein